MPYKIGFRKRALKEYLDAAEWYKERSLQASENFISIIEEALQEIKSNPDHFQKIYKNFRQIKAKKYPFSIVYFIDEKTQTVIVTTYFHHKRNPKNKFK
jgi:mRNA-degrading endonuclease RelE of RelBE toxin-antitoxin system